MSFLRFLMFLALIVWVGGLIFFIVVAGVSFSVLPNPHLAGLVVRQSLIILHWMGIGAGLIFLATSMLYNRMAHGSPRALGLSNLLICLMLALTAISQFAIIPRMDVLRAAAGEISSLPAESPIAAQFNALHIWSTRLEIAVLVLGLCTAYRASRQQS